jgi:hypothetical protein
MTRVRHEKAWQAKTRRSRRRSKKTGAPASLKANRKTLEVMNSGTAEADNQASAIMLVVRQLDLLQASMDKTGGQ